MPVPGIIPPPRTRELSVAFAANTDNVDLFDMIGSPGFAVDVYVTVNTDVIIGAALNPGASEPEPAFTIEGFASGSRVYIENNGRIAGGGGIGGDGDRGRRDTLSASPFVGGGGGGGAGSSSQGGLESAVDFDADNSATDGAAGTDELGGAAGTQDENEAPGVSDGGYARGAAAQTGGMAIYCNGVDLHIENALGEIWAGADGGEGGYQNGSLSGGNTVAPEAGDNIAGDVTLASVEGDEAEAVYISGGTLTWVSGDTYPNVAGYVREIA